MSQRIKLTYEFVKNYFKEQGCELLEENYINARTKMRYICLCKKESSIVFDSFRQGNRCKDGGVKKTSEAQRGVRRGKNKGQENLTTESVSKFFKEQGCELLDEYFDAVTPMRYVCICKNQSEISWSNFYKGSRCQNCLKISRSGPNNYQWIEDQTLYQTWLEFKNRCYGALNSIKTGSDDSIAGEHFLGYDRKQFWSTITNNPNWEFCKGRDWQIDHIFPFNAFREYEIWDEKLINGLDNIQPMLSKDNISKHDKYDKYKFLEWLKSKGVEVEERDQ